MWFLFGFVTLAGFTALGIYWRVHAAWRGSPARADTGVFERQVGTRKWGRVDLKVAVKVDGGFGFSLKPESGLDRFFAGMGISSEHATGDARFDKQVYIVSDDPSLCALLTRSGALRAVVLDLFAPPRLAGYQLKEIACRAGRLWVHYRSTTKVKADDAERAAIIPAAALHAFARALESAPASPHARWREPYALKAVVFLAISTALAVNGLIHWMRLEYTSGISVLSTTVPFTDDPWQLLWPAIAVGGAAAFLLATAALIVLRRSARTHLVLAEILLVGTCGAIATAYVEITDLNRGWDDRPAQLVEATVAGKRTVKGRRQGLLHYLEFRDMPGQQSERSISVRHHNLIRLERGDRVIVHFKPGRLGAPWVQAIEGPNGLNLR